MHRLAAYAAALLTLGCLAEPPPTAAVQGAEPPPRTDGAASADASVAAQPAPDPVEDAAPAPDPEQPQLPPGVVAHDEATDARGGHPVNPHDGPARVAYLIDGVGDSDWLRFDLPAPAAVAIRVLPLGAGDRCAGMATLALFADDARDPRAVTQAARPGQCPSLVPRDHTQVRALPAGVWQVRVGDLGWQKQDPDAPENVLEVAVLEPLAEGAPCVADGELRACDVGFFCDLFADAPVCAPVGCGDGVVDPDADEQCDDGNGADGDGCSAACAVEDDDRGGHGAACAGDLDCAAGTVCRAGHCAAAVCGDGVLDPGEECEGGAGCVHCVADHPAPRNVEPDDADAPYPLDLAEGFAEVGFTLTPAGDVDHFVFELAAPAAVTVQTRGFRDAGCEGDTVLELFGPDGAALDRNDDRLDGQDRLCSLIEAMLDAGVYSVRASTFAQRTAGLNLLQVRLGDVRGVGDACDPLDPAAQCGPGAACGDDGLCRRTVCGDGVAEGGEQCDDGNADDEDGCTVACVFAPVAIGRPCWIQGQGQARVACVAGAYCRFDGQDPLEAICRAHVCGDGVLGPDEECDPGEAPDPRCAADCTRIPLAEGEPCGGAQPCGPGLACDPDVGACVLDVCGNGLRGADEQCDDGNRLDGDGCDAACAAEPAPAIDGSGDYASAGNAGADRFPLDLNGPARARFETTGADGACPGDTVLRLLDADGAPLAENDDGGVGLCSLLELDLDPGRYTVEVAGFNGRPLPPYVLRVDLAQLDPDQPL